MFYKRVCVWTIQFLPCAATVIASVDLMLTWRQLAGAACWVWCCAGVVSEG